MITTDLARAYQDHLQALAALPEQPKYVGPVTTDEQHGTITALLVPVIERSDAIYEDVRKMQEAEAARVARIKTRHVTVPNSNGMTRGEIRQTPTVRAMLADGWEATDIDTDFVGRAVVTFEREEVTIERPGYDTAKGASAKMPARETSEPSQVIAPSQNVCDTNDEGAEQ